MIGLVYVRHAGISNDQSEERNCDKIVFGHLGFSGLEDAQTDKQMGSNRE